MPQDYIIRFKSKTTPGTLFNGVEEWNLINQKQDSFDYKIIHKEPFKSINQTLHTISDMDLKIQWNFESINDSTTFITAGISEEKHSVYNRITAPFSNTLFKRTSLKLIKDYKEGIEYQLKEKFKVEIIGVDSIPEITYAYLELKNIEMRNKAQQMMMNNTTLLKFLNEQELKEGVLPFLIIDNWNLDNNTIDFRYCFRVKELDSMPFHENIKFDKQLPQKALKAIYYGNYITSDRGWFALHEYAARHNISVENKPLEIFYNNPFYGGDELKWETAVFLPIHKE
jgi:effector-binding domain-containing protein